MTRARWIALAAIVVTVAVLLMVGWWPKPIAPPPPQRTVASKPALLLEEVQAQTPVPALAPASDAAPPPAAADRSLTISGIVRWEPVRQDIRGQLVACSSPNDCIEINLPPDGRFSVPTSPNQSWKLIARMDTMGNGSASYIVQSPPIDVADRSITGVEIVLRNLASVSGVVVDTDNNPVAGATVLPRSLDAKAPVKTFPSVEPTNERGEFTVASLYPGRWHLVAEHEGFAPSLPAKAELAPAEAATGIRLQLQKTSFVAGRILAPNGKPLPGAKVMLYDEEGFELQAPVVADDEGAFRIDKVPSTQSLNLQAWGGEYSSGYWRSPDVVLNDATAEYTLPGGSTTFTLVGSVLDAESGDPVAGLVVEPRSLRAPKVTVEADDLGIFRIEGLKPNTQYSYTLGAPGYPDQSIGTGSFDLPASGLLEPVVHRTFKMVREARLVGRVVLAADQSPVAGQEVALVLNVVRGIRRAKQSSVSTTTDNAGRFLFKNVPPGDHEVVVTPKEPLVERAVAVAIKAAGETDLGDVALDRGRGLRVRVTTPDGDPKQGVAVEALRGAAPAVATSLAREFTNSEGIADFAGLGLHPYYFRLAGENYQVRLDDLSSLGPDAEIVVPTGTATVAVRVEHDGKPFAAAPVDVNLTRTLGEGATLVSTHKAGGPHGEGRWMEINGLAAGPWKVSCFLKSMSPAHEHYLRHKPTATVELVNGERTEVVLRLDSASISGRVLDAGGRALAGMVVSASGDGGQGVVVTKVDGTFRIAPLGPGRFTLTSRHASLGEATLADIVIDAGDQAIGPLTLRLVPPPAASGS